MARRLGWLDRGMVKESEMNAVADQLAALCEAE
jgi:hypothetical protein